MKVHDETVKGYSGTLEELAIDVGNLRYDSLNKFLVALSEKILDDAIKDKARGREKLYNTLSKTFVALNQSIEAVNEAWNICRPFEEKAIEELSERIM